MICLFVLDFVMQTNGSRIMELIINGLIAVGVALVPIIILLFNQTYRGNLLKLLGNFKRLFKKKNSVKIANDILKTKGENKE